MPAQIATRLCPVESQLLDALDIMQTKNTTE